MDSLIIGVIGKGGQELAKKFGKKGTSSDITFYNNIIEGRQAAFIVPHSYPEKISSLLQVVNIADFVILNFNGDIDYSLGEIIVTLNHLGKKGMIFVNENYMKESLGPLIGNTILERWEIFDDISKLREHLASLERVGGGEKLRIVIDHFFMVKSVGLVVLGTLKEGEIKKYDKVFLNPGGKEVLIKSIQVNDKDVESTKAPSRVGLVLKNCETGELERGQELCKEKEEGSKELDINFRRLEFYKGEIKDELNIGVSSAGMIKSGIIKSFSGEQMEIELGSRIIGKEFIIFRNDFKDKLRIIGFGNV